MWEEGGTFSGGRDLLQHRQTAAHHLDDLRGRSGGEEVYSGGGRIYAAVLLRAAQ